MKELVNLKDTQDAVQCLSGWCIRNRKFSYKIARCWLKCAKKGKNYFSFYHSLDGCTFPDYKVFLLLTIACFTKKTILEPFQGILT